MSAWSMNRFLAIMPHCDAPVWCSRSRLGSANGTFVNGVAALDWTHVYSGDDVRLGLVPLKIVVQTVDRRMRRFDDTRPTIPAPEFALQNKPTMQGVPAVRSPRGPR